MDQENYPVESNVANESSSSQSDAQLSEKKSKTRYTLLFKLKVINEYHKCKNINNCSRLFGIDRRVISKWLKNEKEIRETQNRRTRTTCHIKVDKCYFPELEKQLYEWVLAQRRNGACLSSKCIRRKSLLLYDEIYTVINDIAQTFEASKGWFFNFCNRRNLALRRITSSGRELPKDAITLIKTFFSACQRETSRLNFVRESIFNMDETSIYLDFPSNYTYTPKGSKRVNAVTTGAEKARISALFTASANGDKLPIYILVPRTSDLPNFTPPENVVNNYKFSATFNDEILVDYVNRVFQPHLLNVLISDYIDDASSNDDLENFIDDQRLLFDEVDEQEDPSGSADNNNPSVDLNSLVLNSSASDTTISSPNASDSASTSSLQNSSSSSNTSSLPSATITSSATSLPSTSSFSNSSLSFNSSPTSIFQERRNSHSLRGQNGNGQLYTFPFLSQNNPVTTIPYSQQPVLIQSQTYPLTMPQIICAPLINLDQNLNQNTIQERNSNSESNIDSEETVKRRGRPKGSKNKKKKSDNN